MSAAQRKRRSSAQKARKPDKRLPETIDGKTGNPDATPRRIDLSSLRDVRLEMAQVYRKVDRKELESQDGSRRVFMLRQIADVIVNTELERRVIDLEERDRLHIAGGEAMPATSRTLN